MARCFSYAQLSSILVFLMVGFARSDLASDRNECATQLAGLATCLPYVQGESKTPTPDCCSGLKQVVAKSRKCVCILVKDRDDPNLGFKINATLALKLPGDCSSPFNATECIDLLHLAPNSSDAQVFKQFQSTLETNNTTTNGAKASPSTSSGSGSGTVVMSTGAAADKGGKRWVVRDMVVGVWTWCLICLVIMGA
ncbi:hypothetical protein MRB53_012165 [Persea americana]|uniref:Uncharacterized protein n=1 Tax=Persea americana TaxID=3435 RepID=A0ACC2LX18_PERAE|nr:hypothetical protein MRB53_012165 [Persea americana]